MGMNALGQQPARGVYYPRHDTAPPQKQKGPKIILFDKHRPKK